MKKDYALVSLLPVEGLYLADLRSNNQMSNATLIALAPTLAAEVVRLREAVEGALDTMLFAQAEIKAQAHIPHDDEEMMNDRIERARQALDATSKK